MASEIRTSRKRKYEEATNYVRRYENNRQKLEYPK